MPKASRIERLARSAGLRVGRNGRFGAGGRKRDISIEEDPLGWITLRRRVQGYTEQEALAAHGDWPGPVKLLQGPGGLEQRVDVFMAGPAPDDVDLLVDRPMVRESEELRAEVIRSARGYLKDHPATDRPNALTARTLQEWIIETGHAAAVDGQGNLRTSITHAAADGQIHVECQPTRLRFEMPLGRWPELDPTSEAAMMRLAAEANAQTRLVRIVWRSDPSGADCRAQVDLTGLTWQSSRDRATLAMCRGMTTMAMTGLALALRRLGRELSILADRANRDLAQSFFDA
jgi:hypothetical protein